jgi:hypothetical protein
MQHRALARPFFARDRISDFELYEKYGSKTLMLVHALSATGTPLDAQDLYARFSLDSTAEFLFGECLDTLQGLLPVAGQARLGTKGSATDDTFGAFVKAFEACQEIVSLRALRGYFWPIREVVHDRMEPHAEVISAYLEPIVQRALERKRKMRQAGIAPSTEHDTFLEYLADNIDGREGTAVFAAILLTSGCSRPEDNQRPAPESAPCRAGHDVLSSHIRHVRDGDVSGCRAEDASGGAAPLWTVNADV